MEFVNGIDVMEQDIADCNMMLLNILLSDKTTKRNILWASHDYKDMGNFCQEEILPASITGSNTNRIQPRIAKEERNRLNRTRDKAEVFTPSWVCNAQNNLIDEAWFGRKNVFNTADGTQWHSTSEPIAFPGKKSRSWKKYVDARRMEISCGEAPYLVSRYDAVSGESIPLENRIGMLDRKLRVVNENAADETEWLFWSKRAFQSVYAYEFQGDSLLLARENLLYTFVDNLQFRLHRDPTLQELKSIANVIAWNIWQMDGMKFVVPNSCHEETLSQFTMFGESTTTYPCPGCQSGDPYQHNGVYCRIHDWRAKKTIRFIDTMKGVKP